jgi:NitT/TauT family transport system substrate-binding protein
VLRQFEPSVMAAGKMDLQATFDNSYVKRANAKYK